MVKDEPEGKKIGLTEQRVLSAAQDLCIKTSTIFSLLIKYSRETRAEVL